MSQCPAQLMGELDTTNVDLDPDLDVTQAVETGKKRKEYDVTKEMMSFCADDAAKKAVRELMAQMANDSDMREKNAWPTIGMAF